MIGSKKWVILILFGVGVGVKIHSEIKYDDFSP